MIDIKTQLNTEFAILPEMVQDFVLSDEVAEAVVMIEKEYQIKPEISEDFALLIMALSIGSISIDRFLQELQYTYHIEEDKVFSILMDVQELILEPLSYLIDSQESEVTPKVGVEQKIVEPPHNLPTEAYEAPLEHPVPTVTTSQEPVSGFIPDHEHLEVHIHDDGPIPLSKNGVLRSIDNGKNSDKDEPVYELK